ncbi:amino acid ABC transporter substrate-binding protein [Xylophilus sp. ASV27]|uniref:amino acid ABC transporter substrate-binding protein n=1 Tax=Xylophilus sp. ASV27 TaxID=2795129 RepID=UPI0018ED8592|nr:amino acid ABC transporter substrate-binding protein [Xylophilus sp. ASV27]
MRRALQALLLAGLGAGMLAGAHVRAESTLEKIRASREIVIGYRADATPFSYDVPGQTQPVGYAIDLCKSIAEAVRNELRLPALAVRYLAVDNTARFPAVTQGRVDLECANTTNTRERREQIGVAFTVPHYIAGTRMLVHTDAGLQRLEDMRGKRIATTRGTTSVGIIRTKNAEMGLDLKINECKDDKECFDLLLARQVDAYLMDDILLYSFRASAPEPQSLQVVGKFLSIEPLAIMLRKDDPAFKKLVDAEMLRLIYERRLQQSYRQWFESPIPPQGRNLRVPMSYLLKDFLKFPSDKVGD